MTTITWPQTREMTPQGFDWGIEHDVQINTARNGAVQTRMLPGARYSVAMSFGPLGAHDDKLAGRREGLLLQLRGGGNRVSLWRFNRPKPNGTITGTPTTSAGVAVGLNSIPLTGCNGTLLRGDMIGIGSQLFTVTADATPSSGAMTVSVEPAVRAPLSNGAAVTLDKPTALFIPTTPKLMFPSGPGVRGGFSLEFVEVWS